MRATSNDVTARPEPTLYAPRARTRSAAAIAHDHVVDVDQIDLVAAAVIEHHGVAAPGAGVANVGTMPAFAMPGPYTADSRSTATGTPPARPAASA